MMMMVEWKLGKSPFGREECNYGEKLSSRCAIPLASVR
jgi:hypothetical protein